MKLLTTIRNLFLLTIVSLCLFGCDLFPTRNEFVVSSITEGYSRDIKFCIRGINGNQKFYLMDSTNTLRVGDTLILVKK